MINLPPGQHWEVSSNTDWLALSPTSGITTDRQFDVTLYVDISGMSAGEYSATVTITVEEADNSPQTVPVSLTIYPPTVTLEMAVGIAQDAASFNLVYYDGVEVTLPTGTEPPELIAVYYYDPVALELLYYFPGWPSTMTQLEHGKVYLIIVSDACQWPIPQP